MSEETLGAKHALERLGLTTTSPLKMIQEVRAIVEASACPLDKAREIISKLAGVKKDFESAIDALHFAQTIAQQALLQDKNFDTDAALAKAQRIVDGLRKNTAMSFIYAQERRPIEDTKEVSGVAVVIKADGKIKKGGKQVLALQLFRDHVVAGGADNKTFVKVLEQELDMSTQGATTYAYNARKAYEAETGKKFEMKKGDKS